MTSGAGRPASRRAPPSRSQVGRQARGEVGVGDGRREALVLAELRQHLAGQRDVDVAASASRSASPTRALVRRGAGRRRAGTRRRPRPRPRAARSTTASSASSSSGASSPSGPIRSRTVKRSSRGTSGAGRARGEVVERRRGPAGRSRCTSRKPSVVTSAVRAPRRSSSALVATVMPCAKAATPRRRGPPPRAAASRRRTGRAGVEGTFAVTRRAVRRARRGR